MPEQRIDLPQKTGVLLLLSLVIGFTIAKLPIVHTPYFWDELGVYAPAALTMKDNNTISLLPASLEPLYSRGHPLLFAATYATAYKYFGDSVATGHWVTIIMSLGCLILLYTTIAKLSDRKTAIVACITLAAQPLFFANAGMVLPEVMLALIAIPCIYAIAADKWWLYAITGSLAMMTKESAIVLPATAFLTILLLRKKESVKTKLWLLVISMLPIFTFLLFLVIQKAQNGWYFFPEHVGYIKYDPTYVADAIIKTLKDLFVLQNRWLITIPIVLLWILHKKISLTAQEKKTMITFWIFIVLGIISASVNFYLARYVVFVLPAIVFISIFSLSKLLSATGRWSSLILTGYTLFAIALGTLAMQPERLSDSSDMSYLQLVDLEEKCIAWVEQQQWNDTLMRVSFPVQQGLEDTRYGYLSGSTTYNCTGDWSANTKHFVFFRLKGNDLPTLPGSTIIKTFENEVAAITVYEFP